MLDLNDLLDSIESNDLIAIFQKDWLFEIRTALRKQLPFQYQLFLATDDDSKDSLLIRRAPENRIVAALELVLPTNKGLSSRFDREEFLLKRDSYFEGGVSYLEIDALRNGARLLPTPLARLAAFERNAWTAFHHRGQQRVRGCGWNRSDSPPVVPWMIEEGLSLSVDSAATLKSASEFNRWSQLV